jgi:hypothetical protein
MSDQPEGRAGLYREYGVLAYLTPEEMARMEEERDAAVRREARREWRWAGVMMLVAAVWAAFIAATSL